MKYLSFFLLITSISISVFAQSKITDAKFSPYNRKMTCEEWGVEKVVDMCNGSVDVYLSFVANEFNYLVFIEKFDGVWRGVGGLGEIIDLSMTTTFSNLTPKNCIAINGIGNFSNRAQFSYYKYCLVQLTDSTFNVVRQDWNNDGESVNEEKIIKTFDINSIIK